MKKIAVAQQIDIAPGSLGRSRQFAVFGLDAQDGPPPSSQRLAFNL